MKKLSEKSDSFFIDKAGGGMFENFGLPCVVSVGEFSFFLIIDGKLR